MCDIQQAAVAPADAPHCTFNFYNYAVPTAWQAFNAALWTRSVKVNNFIVIYWPPTSQVSISVTRMLVLAGIMTGVIKTTTRCWNTGSYYHNLEEEFKAGVDGEDMQVDISPYLYH